MQLTIPNVTDGSILPMRYTGDGSGVSPELSWQDVPKNAKSLVLICEDPDAPSGMFTHWIVYNLPVNVTGLAEGVKDLPTGAKLGLNTMHEKNYCPPAPPSGVHRYYFRLYALDTLLNITNPTRDDILNAMKDHVVASASLLTKYQAKT